MMTKLRNDLLTHRWRTNIQFVFMLTMMTGLFFSRGLLSVSMISFILLSFLHHDLKKQFQVYFQTPLLWGMSLLFLVPLISGAWSADKEQWVDVIVIKLPLLFLPLAFAGLAPLSKRHWEWLAAYFVLLILGSSAWTMKVYLSDPTAVNESYLRAKTMITPLANDHVRYSWMVSVGLLISATFFIKYRKTKIVVAYIWFLLGIWFLVFLHIVSARTGLVSAYLMVLIVVLWLIFKKTNWKAGLLLLCIFSCIPFLAYQLIPSFQNKVKFFLYEKGYFEKTNYLPGSTDAVRIISIKTGWNLMKESPVIGKGFGDIKTETIKLYHTQYPQMIESDKIEPSSEWMIYGAGAGWMGFILFTLSMLSPFITVVRNKLPWILLNGIAMSSFIFDIGLEVQFGVFIHAFTILSAWKWLKAEND